MICKFMFNCLIPKKVEIIVCLEKRIEPILFLVKKVLGKPKLESMSTLPLIKNLLHIIVLKEKRKENYFWSRRPMSVLSVTA